MKKNFIHIAILVAGMLLTACGNKQTVPAVIAEGGETGQAEQTAAQQQMAAAKSTINKKSFSIALPEGWQSMPSDDGEDGKESLIVFKGKDMTELMSAAFMMVSVGDSDGMSLEDGISEFEKDTKAKAGKDITINGKTYKAFTAVEDGQESTFLFAQEEEKFISFLIGKSDANDPEIQTIINTFKLK
jgi:major membrane immunogen (membrane-anchored lipoprotein)